MNTTVTIHQPNLTHALGADGPSYRHVTDELLAKAFAEDLRALVDDGVDIVIDHNSSMDPWEVDDDSAWDEEPMEASPELVDKINMAAGGEGPAMSDLLMSGASMNTTRYVMTDDHARTAYVQDWTLNEEGEVVDVTEVQDLDIPDADDLPHDEWLEAVKYAAGYELVAAGDNNDLGVAWKVVDA